VISSLKSYAPATLEHSMKTCALADRSPIASFILECPAFWQPRTFAITRYLSAAFAVAYPLVAHIAASRDSLALTLLAIALLAAATLMPALVRGNIPAWLAAAGIAFSCWLLWRMSLPVLPLYIAPVLVPAFMAWVFGHTLSAGSVPLIARLIRALHADDEPEPAVWQYARALTLAWTLFFIALASSNLLLAAFAEPGGLLLASGISPALTVPRQWWSLFANVLGYVLVALFFVIEYAYRRHRFPKQPYRNFFDFLRRMSAVMPQLLR
jgi:uncharacterized membrane protein